MKSPLPHYLCYDHSIVVTLNAHFDGKVIVPDEPLELAPNQKLRISIEPIESAPKRTDFSEWIGLASSPRNQPYDPTDEDALWDKGPLRCKPESDRP